MLSSYSLLISRFTMSFTYRRHSRLTVPRIIEDRTFTIQSIVISCPNSTSHSGGLGVCCSRGRGCFSSQCSVFKGSTIQLLPLVQHEDSLQEAFPNHRGFMMRIQPGICQVQGRLTWEIDTFAATRRIATSKDICTIHLTAYIQRLDTDNVYVEHIRKHQLMPNMHLSQREALPPKVSSQTGMCQMWKSTYMQVAQ
jgi:hypothetical protein